MTYRPDPSFRHPLTDLVLAAFKERPLHDATTLASALSGSTFVEGGLEGMSAERAYRLVAVDVLGCLEQDGLLTKNDDGWYRKTEDDACSQAAAD